MECQAALQVQTETEEMMRTSCWEVNMFNLISGVSARAWTSWSFQFSLQICPYFTFLRHVTLGLKMHPA